MLIVLLLLAGPAGEEIQIDPQRVTSIEFEVGEEMALNIFMYDRADFRGWPASPEDRQFVRFLQDNGVKIAFEHDASSNLHYVLIFGSDFSKFLQLKQEAQQRGIPVPEMLPKDEMSATRLPGRATGSDPPWWMNVAFLIGMAALLIWAFRGR